MAAAEVLAFAASDGWHAPPSFSEASRQGGASRCRRNNQFDTRLQSQLSLISEAWVQLRCSPHFASSKDCRTNPLIIPDFCSPRWSRTRRLPAPSIDDSVSSVDLRNISCTDSTAQIRRLGPEDRDVPLPSSQAGRQRRDDRDVDLIAEPNMDLIDFRSDEGFIEAAGKKKKKQTTSFNWLEDENDKKDGDGTEEGGDGNKDTNGGDAGAGGGAGGDGGGDDGGKQDDDKNGAEVDPDNIWGFSTVGSKKKKNKDKTADAFGLPELPPVSTDFHEIKLDDSGGATSLDFGLSPKTEKPKTGISAWTSGWGGGGWGWGGLTGSQTEASKPAQEEKTEYPVDDSPWGINRPKPKKKETSTFSFGALGKDDGSKDANSFDFLGGSKSSETKDVGAFSWGAPKAKTGDDDSWDSLSNKKDEAPKEEEKPAEEAADDIWGWSSSKKDKKKKGKATIVGESLAAQDEPLPEAPDAPDAGDKQPESALTPDEETELLKLQTKKDIGSKLTKKQTDRYKVLTDRAEEAAKAAEAAAPKNAEPASGGTADLLEDAGALADVDPAGGSAPLDDAQAEADEKARIIQEEEVEMAQLRGKKKLKKADKDRLRVLEDRADERLREDEEKAAASGSNGQDDPTPESVDILAGNSAPAEDPVPEVDGAQAEADEKARIVQEEEDEMAELKAKKKLKRADKDRLQELEDRAESRAREAEEMAAAAQAEADATQAAAAQAEADEKAKIIQEEKEEMAQLRAKKKLKSADKERLRILEENADLRSREAQTAQPDEPPLESGADSNESKSDETAPTSVDDAGAQADKDEAARLIEEEELEIELLLSKSKLKKADKTRLKELQDNKEKREQDAAAKADAAAVPDPVDESAPPAEDVPASGDIVGPVPDEGEHLAKKLIEEEELELELLLSKSKLKKAEKARMKELQDNKDQREYEAAAKAASEPIPESAEPRADGAADSGPVLDDAPIDETAAQDALVAAEESELTDLLSKAKLKKAEKARLKELQDRKDQRDEEARRAAEKAEEDERLAREKAEQEARELEDRKRREEIEAEEAEIASLKSKKKLKKSEKDRLSELEFRAQDRASAEAEKLAAELLKEDAENEVKKDEAKVSKGFSWADDDPADENGAGDDWMDWGLSSSKKSKKKDKSSPLIEFGGTVDAPAVPGAPPAIPEADAFDFGWGKPKKKDVQTPADDLWSFGTSSKKKSKNSPAEVIDDPIKADFMGDTKDKMGGDDFWSTFGVDKKDKSSRKNALAMQPPPPAPTPPSMDLTETEVDAHDAGDAWDDPSGSTELSRSKSKSSDKDSKKSSKEPKLSKKDLEKLEKEKKKAEKEQKEREKREAEEAAEKERIAEEERLATEAKAEEERLAREAEELARQEEEAKQAAIDAIALEEADLAVLQGKKDSGKKLTKKDKEKYDKLSASCQARADEKAAQEAAEQAARDEEERLAREAEELARQQEIEKEDAELQELQKKKDSGRKLLKKDKEKYELLRANKKARDKAAEAASAPVDEAAPADGPKAEDDLDKDLAKLDANQLDELDQFLSSPTKPTARAAEVDPFDFWGASKKSPKPKKGKSPGAEPVSACLLQPPLPPLPPTPALPISTTPTPIVGVLVFISVPHVQIYRAPAEIAHAESYKLLEATTSDSAVVENSASKDVVAGAWSAWQDTYPSSRPRPDTQFGGEVDHHDLDIATSAPASTPSPALMKGRKSVGGKIADRLKAFEATIPPPPPAPVADAIPPPPPPPQVEPVVEDGKKKKKSKSRASEIPGSFPVEDDEQLPDDIVEVIEMSTKVKKSKKSKSKTEDAASVPPPPPAPPAVPDAPLSPPPEVVDEPKKEGKKERAKISRDGGSSWGMWSASTPSGKEKKSSKSRAAEEPRREKKSRSPEKEEKLSAPGSSSDKAERSERVKDMAKETPVRPKLMSVFNSTPPISRSLSTREKRHKEGKSSRRGSFDVPSGIVSPPPEDEVPTMSSKAAKILGVGIGDSLGRSSSKRKKSSRAVEEDDIVMVGANDAMESSPEKSSRRRHKQYPREDDDIVMVDAADATPPPGLRRSNTSGSTKKGLGGLFGGILSTPKTDPKPELRRRNTHHHTDAEDGGAATDADAEARKAARRLRRAEREAADKEAEDSRRARDEARREKRRKQEEDEREARRAERRAAKSRQEGERRAAEEKEAAREERRRQKRLERQQEREHAAANGETAVEDDEARRAARRERRKARAAAESDREPERRHADDDEERRRRRAERRAARDTAEGKTSSRRRTERADDDPGRPPKLSRRHTDGLDKMFRKSEPNPNPWPYSGTSSWVKDHSDAGPPPEDAEVPNEAVDDIDDAAARQERRRRRKYGDGVVDIEVGDEDGERRRRKRREERAGGSDGSGERKRHSYVGDAYATATPRSSASSWWKKLKGN